MARTTKHEIDEPGSASLSFTALPPSLGSDKATSIAGNLLGLRLTCDDACDEFRIHSWTSTVANESVHELDLYVTEHEPYVIPSSIYRCESLEALKILYSYSRVVFTPPTLISLPSLRTLVIFKDEGLIQQFFSSSPALQHLNLHNFRFPNHKKLVFFITSLNHLRITEPRFEYNEEYSQTIKIFAPNLDHLCGLTETLPREYIL
ncbi:hypothetical protein Syun_010164 [Stephania yunnanensis]|uniref:F-box/LRR-repeat protein 15/At3g58940/PEG3-like LRR domain-containing protein n=1 Tax=Stephania yunnanensis TaxID=152371 RepID=A0AAP0PRJ5_9MAGN